MPRLKPGKPLQPGNIDPGRTDQVRVPTSAGALDVRGLLALLALGDVEGDLFAFLQCLEPVHGDRGEMREQIFAAVVGRDEAEACFRFT